MYKEMITACRNHRESGREYYETILWAAMLMNSGLAIVPTKNLINNLGAAEGSVHYSNSLATMPKRLRRLFTMRRFELTWPLRHPRYVMENTEYKEMVYRTHAWGHPWIKIGRSMEELVLNLRHGNISIITKALTHRIKKWMGMVKHA